MRKMTQIAGCGAVMAALAVAGFELRPTNSEAQPITHVASAPLVHRVAQAPEQQVAPAPTVAPTVTHAPRVQPAPAGALRVRRLVVARSIVNREPQSPAARFRMNPGDRLYAFVEVENRARPVNVRVHFEPHTNAGRAVGLVELSVPTAARWRTWGYSDFVRSRGEWDAVVETADGHELARTPFTVE